MQWRGVNFDVVAHWVVALSTPDRKVVGSIPSRAKFLFSVSMSSLSAFWTSRITSWVTKVSVPKHHHHHNCPSKEKG
jgi:hypothetical protein